MKKLTYDPTNGNAIPDGQVIQVACDLPDEYTTSNELLITAVRALVCHGTLSHEEIEIYYRGELIHMNSDGRIKDWPQGFCDNNDKFLEMLLEVKH